MEVKKSFFNFLRNLTKHLLALRERRLVGGMGETDMEKYEMN